MAFYVFINSFYVYAYTLSSTNPNNGAFFPCLIVHFRCWTTKTNKRMTLTKVYLPKDIQFKNEEYRFKMPLSHFSTYTKTHFYQDIQSLSFSSKKVSWYLAR